MNEKTCRIILIALVATLAIDAYVILLQHGEDERIVTYLESHTSLVNDYLETHQDLVDQYLENHQGQVEYFLETHPDLCASQCDAICDEQYSEQIATLQRRVDLCTEELGSANRMC